MLWSIVNVLHSVSSIVNVLHSVWGVVNVLHYVMKYCKCTTLCYEV